MNLFGFEIKKKRPDKSEVMALDISDELADSGVVVTNTVGNSAADWSSSGGAIDGLDYMEGVTPPDEVEKIQNYRSLALSPEVDEALNEIRNEVFLFDVPGKRAFEVDFLESDDAPSDKIKKAIIDESNELYNIIDFDKNGGDFFDSWYINGRLYAQKIIDSNAPKEGLKAVRILDPLNIRRVKWVQKDAKDLGINLSKIQDWFVYSKRFDQKLKYGAMNLLDSGTTVQGLKIRPDSIAYADSGLKDLRSGKTIGYLDKAILPFNGLKLMEDAMTIFRVVRAPQRRAIYVDVGQLQKNKADSYVKELMARFRNKMTYDSTTGTLTDRKNIMSMSEDYWLPRREGSKGTEIQTLDGQDANGVLEEVEYHRDKLWRALGVPRSRFGQDSQSFVFGKGVEIQRDEYRFKKYLSKLRRNFMEFYSQCLKTQLILKGIIAEEDWLDIQKTMTYVYAEDNAFTEWKESEIINNRIATVQAVDVYVGKYFTVDWVRKNVLRQTDADISAFKKQMEVEKKEGYYGEIEDVQQNLDTIYTGQATVGDSGGPGSVEIGSSPVRQEP